MDPIIRKAKLLIENAIFETYPQLPRDKCPKIAITPASPKLEVESDFTCPTAMQLTKIIVQTCSANQSPSQVAEAIKTVLESGNISKEFSQVFTNLNLSKPGFINFSITTSYAAAKIKDLVSSSLDNGLKINHRGEGRVIVDYSSPNIAKDMHVGHLRSTIIGDCVANLLEYANYSVLRLNHVGDWGTQFGMLLALLFERYGQDYDKFTDDIRDLQNFYKEAKARFDTDEEFKKRSYSTVIHLQSKESEAIKAWQKICEVSRREFNCIYERLNITNLIERGESFYHDMMKDVVADLKERKYLIEDEGRLILWGQEKPGKNDIPLTIAKSDGGFTYDTSDLAALKQRIEHENGIRILYVADNGQSVHFQTIFAAARRVGYMPLHVKAEHIGFGLVLGEDKKKFKTRSGDTVKLVDLLDEGIQRAGAKLLEKNRQEELTEQEISKAKQAVAYGCIKYADLSRDRNKDYIFSFDQMLDDKGNTAVYLLYSLTRIRSIKRRANLGSLSDILKQRIAEQGDNAVNLSHEREAKLAKFLLRFPDIVLQCIDDLLFHLLANYLYELSGVFTDFYEACYCIERSGDEITKIHYDRLLLCEATALVLDKGLSLLGIETLERM